MASKELLKDSHYHFFAILLIALVSAAVIFSNSLTGAQIATASKPIVSISHSPVYPQIGETVTISATASSKKGLSQIEIYADSLKAPKKICRATSCEYTIAYSTQGNHTYYAAAKDKAGSVATTKTGSFSVASSKLFTSSIVSKTPNSVKIAWTKPNFSFSQYHLWQRACGAGIGAWQKRAELLSTDPRFNSRTYTFTGLTAKKCYDFKIVALSSGRTETPSVYTSVAASNTVKQTDPEFISIAPG